MNLMPHLWVAAGAFLMAGGIRGQRLSEPVLKPLHFLTGQWITETLAEVQEETWTLARGSSMLGSFRVLRHGKPVFYEFWAVELEAGQPVLKLKHFNADLVGWEEKNSSVKLALVSSGVDDAVFAEANGGVSLHYHRTGKELSCIVHHVKDGKATDERFVLHRATNPSRDKD